MEILIHSWHRYAFIFQKLSNNNRIFNLCFTFKKYLNTFVNYILEENSLFFMDTYMIQEAESKVMIRSTWTQALITLSMIKLKSQCHETKTHEIRNLEKVVSIRSWRRLFVHEGIVLKAMSGNLTNKLFALEDYATCWFLFLWWRLSQ